MSYLVQSITVGEVGEKNVEIRDSVTDLTFALSASSVSEIKVTVHDPDFKMHNSNYFMIGRRVAFVLPDTAVVTDDDGDTVEISIRTVDFEIAAVTASHGSHDTVSVTARNRKMQQMRREKGKESFGKISPTAFAAAAAARPRRTERR